MSLNVCVLIGRLTRDPELRYTPSGKAVCNFTLAVDRRSAGEDKQADFIDIVVWDKQAESSAQHLTKGRQVAVEGRLQSRRYEAKDGSQRTVWEVVAHNVRFLAKPGASIGQEVPPPDEADVPF